MSSAFFGPKPLLFLLFRQGGNAALAVVLLAVVAFWAWPAATGPSPSSPTSTSRPGHFDNGTFSFDYPTTWRTISGSYVEIIVNEVDVVMGTGDWQTGCRSWSSADRKSTR